MLSDKTEKKGQFMCIKLSVFIFIFIFSSAFLSLDTAYANQDIIDNLNSLQSYEKADGIRGVLKSEGSDTMDPIIKPWCEKFASYYGGNVLCEISDGKGSGSGPPLLLDELINVARLSRPYKRKEVDKFIEKFGYRPLMMRTALDTLGVFVNKDNPIDCVTMKELDAIFSQDMKCGPNSSINRWNQLDVLGIYNNKKISLFGRIPLSGTHQFFKKKVLCKGPFKSVIREYGDSPNITRDIENNIYGIGYAGISYLTPGTKALAVSNGEKNQEECIPATAEFVANATYPISRILYIYLNKKPGEPLEPLLKEFMKFVLSKEGQEIVYLADFYPLSKESIENELSKLD